jgi:hypothetical protein
VLLCFGEACNAPFTPVPTPVSTVPPFVPVFVPVLLPAPLAPGLIAEVEGALSGAAVKDVNRVVGNVVDGFAWPIDVKTDDIDEMPTGGAIVADGAGIEVVNGAATGGVDLEVVGAGEFPPTPKDNTGAVVGPTPAPSRGPEVGATAKERIGAVVGPTPTPSRGLEVGAAPSERRGSEVGPMPTPNRAPPPAADDVLESPPRTVGRRPPAALPTPPKRPPLAVEVAVYRYLSHILGPFGASFTFDAAGADAAAEESPPPRIPPNNPPPSGVAAAEAAEVVSLPPPRSPPNSAALISLKCPSFLLSTPSPRCQIPSLIATNYKRKSLLRRKGRGSRPNRIETKRSYHQPIKQSIIEVVKQNSGKQRIECNTTNRRREMKQVAPTRRVFSFLTLETRYRDDIGMCARHVSLPCIHPPKVERSLSSAIQIRGAASHGNSQSN